MSLFDDASLVLTPNGVKSGKVYSIKPTDGVGDFDFTRASSATRVNSDGLIETVSTGVPRLDYPLLGGCPSLLLEPQRTNSLNYSGEFDNASWPRVNSTATANQTTSPSGDSSADLIQETTATGSHDIRQNAAVTSGLVYTYSIFVKRYEGGSDRNITFFIGGPSGAGTFNFDTGSWQSVSGLDSYGAEQLNDGWWRIYLSDTSISTAFNVIVILNNGSTSSYTGDGVSGVYLWGAQLEQGSYATSYIPTSGSSVTRVAEACNGAGDANTFNDSEGVLYAEVAALANENTFRNICISDGSTSDKIQFYYRPDANQITMLITASSVLQSSKTLTLSSALEFNKISIKYKTNDFSLWVNGFELFTQSSGSTPLGLSELAFDDGVGNNDFYGKTKQLITFKQALTDAELEDLTSWDSFSEMATAQLYKLN